MGARGQEPLPVLRHARAHLRAFEILAQPLARLDQVGGEERLAVRALAPGQRGQRRFREVDAHRAAHAVVIGDARLAELRVLGLKPVAASANPSAFRAGGPRRAAA
jgi:hypothetical protein